MASPEVDALGRGIYRVRKHDIEEFHEIIARHGCYKRDLEQFAKVIEKRKQQTLPLDEPPAPDPDSTTLH
jgi:hypothetical protein